MTKWWQRHHHHHLPPSSSSSSTRLLPPFNFLPPASAKKPSSSSSSSSCWAWQTSREREREKGPGRNRCRACQDGVSQYLESSSKLCTKRWWKWKKKSWRKNVLPPPPPFSASFSLPFRAFNGCFTRWAKITQREEENHSDKKEEEDDENVMWVREGEREESDRDKMAVNFLSYFLCTWEGTRHTPCWGVSMECRCVSSISFFLSRKFSLEDNFWPTEMGRRRINDAWQMDRRRRNERMNKKGDRSRKRTL